MASYTTMSLDALKFLCSTINKVVDLPTTVISDTSVATNTTYSSYKIGLDMDNMENEIKSYVDTIIAGLNKLTKEIINDKALVVKDNVLYLYKAADDVSNNYMQMMLINGVAVELGSTQADFSNIYNKSEVDSKFAAKLDLDTLTTSFNDLKDAYDNHVADTDVHVTKELKDKLVTTDDITTTISSTSTDSEVPTAKAVNEKVKITEEAMKEIAKEEAKELYSTDEQVIGTWIDGKPIYRIYVSFPTFELKPYEWNTVNSLSITGIDEIVNARAKRNEDNSIIPLATRSRGTSIEVNPSSNFGIGKLILEYTKTTDA